MQPAILLPKHGLRKSETPPPIFIQLKWINLSMFVYDEENVTIINYNTQTKSQIISKMQSSETLGFKDFSILEFEDLSSY